MGLVAGEILQVTPEAIAAGQPLSVNISFNASAQNTISQGFGVKARLVVTLDSFSGWEDFNSLSGVLKRTNEKVRLNGAMPHHSVSGMVTLKVRDYSTPFTYNFVTVDTKRFTIKLPEVILPVSLRPDLPADEVPYAFDSVSYQEPVATPGLAPVQDMIAWAKDNTLVLVGLGLAAITVYQLTAYKPKKRKA